MPELTDLSVIRALCEKYDFALSKGFGQNFIINPGIPTKIVDASGVDKRYGVIEIGPGIGVLTKELAKRAAKVVSIEVDERLPPLLAETMAGVDNFKSISLLPERSAMVLATFKIRLCALALSPRFSNACLSSSAAAGSKLQNSSISPGVSCELE